MKKYSVLYEEDDASSETWVYNATSLLDCIGKFTERFGRGSWVARVIDWVEEDIEEEPNFRNTVFIVLATMILSSCGLDVTKIHGKKHQLVPGNQQLVELRARNKAIRDSTKKLNQPLISKK